MLSIGFTGKSTEASKNSDTSADMEMSNSPVSSVTGNNLLQATVTDCSWSYSCPPGQPTMALSARTGLNSEDPSATTPLMMMMNAAGYAQLAFLTGNPPASPSTAGGLVLPSSGSAGLSNVVKEIVHLAGAIVYPPKPNAPPPQTRERPPGCRTVFVGGLPEKCTEELVRELFERCGEIYSLRMSKKNFAHIRFVSQDCVDRALYFSGYRMKVDNRGDKEYSGKLHVDFAQARDDQYEFECAQRAVMREHRHRNRSGSESPSRTIAHYSDHEASQLLEKLKVADTLGEAVVTLVGWLEKGECSKKSATQFYSMIAAVYAHVRRLMQEKQLFDTDLENFKAKHCEKLQTLMTQFSQIEQVFRTARKQRNWDHFTKAQRKNLDQWLKQAEGIRKNHENDMLSDRKEENMETSDDDDEKEPSGKKSKFDPAPFFQQQIEDLTKELEQTKEKLEAANCELDQRKENSADLNVGYSRNKDKGSREETAQKYFHLSLKEARFIALACQFLNVHPFGVSAECVCSYLNKISAGGVSTEETSVLLNKYSSVFRMTDENLWKFVGFENCS